MILNEYTVARVPESGQERCCIQPFLTGGLNLEQLNESVPASHFQNFFSICSDASRGQAVVRKLLFVHVQSDLVTGGVVACP